MASFIRKKKSDHCQNCSLHSSCQSPGMLASGNGRKKILIMGEAPGPEEDKMGSQFVGRAGKFLYNECRDIGFDIYKDCNLINAINCFPGYSKNGEIKKPTRAQINACRQHWKKEIEKLKPEKIILLGASAVEAFVGDRTTNVGGISKWAGFKIPDQDYKCWVFPTYHPSYVLRNEGNIVLEDRFYYHLCDAFDHPIKPFPVINPKINILMHFKDTVKFLEDLIYKIKPSLLSFDFETTGIKPHRKSHQIKTVSFCFEKDQTYSMPFFDDWKFRDLFQLLMEDLNIGKTAHNIKYEEIWCRIILGFGVKNWIQDTMIDSHILDNRGGISSLEFQTYINFGVIGYGNEITSYIEGTKEGEDPDSKNRLNKIDDAPRNKLLEYNAKDAFFGYLIALKQNQKFKGSDGLRNIRKLFFDGVKSFCDVEEEGWSIDEEYFDNIFSHLLRVNKYYQKQIIQSPENMLWKKINKTDINPASFKQLSELFFDKKYLGLNPIKKTRKDNDSVDKEVLEVLADKSRLALSIGEIRKNKGLIDKVKGFQREVVNGLIHPSYNLHIARSGRSSCTDPNQQNNPKRDEESKKIIRRGIIPKKGRILMARDFSGVEVATSCFYHKDPVMIDYIKKDPGRMHTDEAVNIFLLLEEEVLENKKTVRHFAKNEFVFPQFYGDYFVNCAKAMWKSAKKTILKSGISLIDHLYENGIRNYNDFEQHIKKEERYFWFDKFKTYNNWKEKTWEKYQEDGYLEYLTGFRCTDILTRNEAANRQIQGTAYHLNQWCINKEVEELKQTNSRLIGQIHDENIFDCDPNELDDIDAFCNEIETKKVVKHYPWINVPLRVEVEISEVDGNWYEMKPFE